MQLLLQICLLIILYKLWRICQCFDFCCILCFLKMNQLIKFTQLPLDFSHILFIYQCLTTLGPVLHTSLSTSDIILWQFPSLNTCADWIGSIELCECEERGCGPCHGLLWTFAWPFCCITAGTSGGWKNVQRQTRCSACKGYCQANQNVRWNSLIKLSSPELPDCGSYELGISENENWPWIGG